ncbi:MAG TPA: bis(5'-nucleosyl)-tetraphosphatase (symmetrical) YqeK, partial [Chloroflexota bacterium]|nr:bis(5'-nucleosyl)-tetraphosphatase (symmetrical) YqeK [Chloroflexota bacterium]
RCARLAHREVVITVDPDIAARLNQLVSPKRYLHCTRVAEFAVKLARKWGLDEDCARRAGLLHDVRREETEPWPDLAAREGIALPDWARGDWTLLHGPLGAKLAGREFPLPRPWLDGIANHSWCRAGATPEELTIYIADHACEGRRYPNVERYRDLAFKSLEQSAQLILTDLLRHLLEDNAPLWPPAVEARNSLVLRWRG